MNRSRIAILTSLICVPLYAADPTPKPATSTPSATPATAAAPAATPVATPRPQIPPPTIADIPYGPHPKQVMDFYKAESDKPTPLVFYIHGGGWMAGSKRPVGVTNYLKAGISVISIEYRFIPEATADGVNPPVLGSMGDAARALQFVRSKAAEWNIDKTKIAATGGSAGACSSLWLAFHDDMADPKSKDPISHESTRLLCAAVSAPQTSLDPQQMKDWTPNSNYGAHAFGIKGDPAKKTSSFAEFLAQRDKIMPWIKEYSPYELVTSDDPPIYMNFSAPPAIGQDQKDPTHSANFGVKLKEKLDSVHVPCELVYPDAPNVTHKNIETYLIEKLKQ